VGYGSFCYKRNACIVRHTYLPLKVYTTNMCCHSKIDILKETNYIITRNLLL
jgi:hypothetical protein